MRSCIEPRILRDGQLLHLDARHTFGKILPRRRAGLRVVSPRRRGLAQNICSGMDVVFMIFVSFVGHP